MFNEYQAYLNMFKNKNVIAEADAGDEEILEVDEVKAEVDKKPNKEHKVENKNTDMKFSVDLATEFSNTINEFTTICAKIVEKRIIDKPTSDKFYDLYTKIKNLADAASKSI